jgi:hypothetical protein
VAIRLWLFTSTEAFASYRDFCVSEKARADAVVTIATKTIIHARLRRMAT